MPKPQFKARQQDAKEIIEGEMCGVSLKETTYKVDVQEGSKLKF